MIRRALRPITNQRGAATIYFGLLSLVFLGLGALAVDVGLMLNTRSEAQRAADAAALAGAGIFIGPHTPRTLRADIEAEALRFASLNHVGGAQAVSEQDVRVSADLDSMAVSVVVRGARSSWFAFLLGYDELPVSARAVARAMPATGVQCVKPFALPDLWEENGDDVNGNGIWDEGEEWTFDPAVDRYERWTGVADDGATGYGSRLRGPDGDIGLRVAIKLDASGSVGAPMRPGHYSPFIMPGGRGNRAYERNIRECNDAVIDFETEYELLRGVRAGPTERAVRDLIGSDQTSFEEAQAGTPTPRVIVIALYDPAELADAGTEKRSVKFNNHVLFYIEQVNGGEIIGRFIGYPSGTTTRGSLGSLVRVAQLVG